MRENHIYNDPELKGISYPLWTWPARLALIFYLAHGHPILDCSLLNPPPLTAPHLTTLCFGKRLICACLCGCWTTAPTQKSVCSAPGGSYRKALNPIRWGQTQNNAAHGVGSPNPAVAAQAPLNVMLSCQAEEKQMDFPHCRGAECCEVIEGGSCIAVQLSAFNLKHSAHTSFTGVRCMPDMSEQCNGLICRKDFHPRC